MLKRSKKPGVVIVGQGALTEADGEAVLSQVMKLAEALGAKLLVLHTAASRVGALDVGCTTEGGLRAATEGVDVVYNLGADEVDIAPGQFVIYQGSHGDRGAHRADLILPGAAYTEEGGLFVNTEGRPQLALRAGFAPGEAKENWAILRALSAELGATQPWDSLGQLRTALVTAVPHLGRIDEVPENEWQPLPLREPGNADLPNRRHGFLPDQPDRPRLGPDGRTLGRCCGACEGTAGGGVGMWRWPCSLLILGLMACTEAEVPEQGQLCADLSRHPDASAGRRSGELPGRDEGRAAKDDVEAYARCAAAQYALIRGYGFARHVRTIVDLKGGVWRGDAVYTISASLPKGLKTIDAEVTVRDCGAQGIPTI